MRGYRLLFVAGILAGGLAAAWPYKLPRAPATAPHPLPQVVDVPLRRPDVLIETSGPSEVSPAASSDHADADYSPVAYSRRQDDSLTTAPDLAAHYTPLADFHPTSWRPAPLPPLPRRTVGRKHRLTDGDSLESLAERYLGDPARSGEIYEANRDTLPAPDLLPLGKIIRIPARETEDGLVPAQE